MSGTRQRIDPRRRETARVRSVSIPEEQTAQPAKAIDPDKLVGVAVKPSSSGLQDSHLAVLNAARGIADAHGGGVVLILLLAIEASLPEALDRLGIDRIIILRHAAFAGYAPEAEVAALVALSGSQPFLHLLFADEIWAGGDCARRMAAQLGQRPALAISAYADGSVTYRQGGTGIEITRPATQIMTIDVGAFPPITRQPSHDVMAMAAPDWMLTSPQLEDQGLLPLDATSVPISEAVLVISAGNGVTDWATFHALASSMGAATAGSRAVVDAGHLPRSRQVGASGQLIAPECYIAFGIAGASQHLQGIARCRRVVAVNTDLHAEMVKRADVAIIADAQAVMPALLQRLRGA